MSVSTEVDNSISGKVCFNILPKVILVTVIDFMEYSKYNLLISFFIGGHIPSIGLFKTIGLINVDNGNIPSFKKDSKYLLGCIGLPDPIDFNCIGK